MHRKANERLLWIAWLLFATPCIAGAIGAVGDLTPRCLKNVAWESDAFAGSDNFDEIFIAASAFDKLVACAYPRTGDAQPSHPPGQARRQPTRFIRANYVLGNSLVNPVAIIVHRGISYVRSPEYPGVCEYLGVYTVGYAWCTGVRGPSTNDPRLIACKNQYCDFSIDDTERRFGR